MTITVAMALSGLEPEQWNDGLKEIYMQGAILFPKSPSSLSLASSGASSYYSLESGISSMSPDSASYNPFLLSDLDGFGVDGVIQVQDSASGNATPGIGTKLGPTIKFDGATASNEHALSSGMVELEERETFNELAGNIGPLLVCNCMPPVMPGKVYSKVIYGNRDVLNLYANISFGGWRCQSAVLPDTIDSFYFENRSQYSRLQGAYPPKHAKAICRDKDCGFFEPSYF